jgi:predicted DNA-binding protein YlxM (UPF0122 family)
MSQQSSEPSKNNSAKYRSQQNQYWNNLKVELEQYRSSCGATVQEIADGLEISRQSLYKFLKKPEQGLPITWATLMSLWDKITQPNQEVSQKLKLDERLNREQMRNEGPEKLLMLTGFMPPASSSTQTFKVSPWEVSNPQVRRAISRLCSNWVHDDIVRTYLANYVIDLVLERGRAFNQSHVELISNQRDIEEWPKERLQSSEPNAIEKYKKEIKKLAIFGKRTFVDSELFELYQSIHEHEILNSRIPNHINIIDCQFRILSDSIKNINLETTQKFLIAEQRLLNYLQTSEVENTTTLIRELEENESKESVSSLLSNPVIEVAIKCDFSYGTQSYPSVIWRYSSTSPHIRNTFSAIKNGLGYPFEMAGISTRSTGRRERSLIRSEVILVDPEQPKQVYQGWWVDSSTIIGLLRAVVDAVKRWLAAQDPEIDMSRYYECFQKLAEIDEKLFISRASFYSHIPDLNHKIANNCVEEIKDIKKKFVEDRKQTKYFQNHIEILTRKSHTARMTQMHIALLEGNIERASNFIDEAEDVTFMKAASQLTRSQDMILILNASSCVMFYYLLTGNIKFLNNKSWRTDSAFCLETNVERLGRYIQENFCIDIDAYLYASQFWGTISYIEFYTATKSEDIDNLRESSNNLIAAAHYACRIGHMKRAIHWLAYASRIFCRLGDLERAKYYAELAQRESTLSSSLEQLGDVEPLMNYSELADKVYSVGFEFRGNSNQWSNGNDQNWSMSNVHLSYGEIAIAEGRQEEAIDHFCKSLIISVNTGFSRLSADSIYNLHRASKTLRIFTENPFLTEVNKKNTWSRNAFTQDLFNFLCKLGAEWEWQEVSDKLGIYSKKIWNNWFVTAKSDHSKAHTFDKLIDQEIFLSNLLNNKILK